jgi:hypothetical protein
MMKRRLVSSAAPTDPAEAAIMIEPISDAQRVERFPTMASLTSAVIPRMQIHPGFFYLDKAREVV